MSIGALDAVSAYGRTGGINAASSPAGESAESGGFGGMVEGLIGQASTSLQAAETAGAQQAAGKGDMIDVVTAIGAAEMALETVVAVRDRVISAYSDIMRMQI